MKPLFPNPSFCTVAFISYILPCFLSKILFSSFPPPCSILCPFPFFLECFNCTIAQDFNTGQESKYICFFYKLPNVKTVVLHNHVYRKTNTDHASLPYYWLMRWALPLVLSNPQETESYNLLKQFMILIQPLNWPYLWWKFEPYQIKQRHTSWWVQVMMRRNALLRTLCCHFGVVLFDYPGIIQGCPFRLRILPLQSVLSCQVP